MPNNYSINFTNKTGLNQMYGVFNEPPKAAPGIDKVYANVWQSQQLANDGSIDLKITKSFYAWCGTAPAPLAPGVVVSIGNSKEADLGSDETPGSTFDMYNNSGSPAFRNKVGHTADPGCYEIDTGTDFVPELNFLMGMAAPDGNGRVVPTASFNAPTNAVINIQPRVDYYISAFSTTQGTAIDWKVQSKRAAHIPFSEHPGMYGALVSQTPNGEFQVKFTASAAEHLYLLQRQEQKGSPLEQEVRKLSDQLSWCLRNFTGSSQATGANQGTLFQGILAYSNQANASQREDIANHMESSITTAGYMITHVGNDDVLDINFRATAVTLLKKVNEDWASAQNSLPAALHGLSQNDGCQVIGGDSSAAITAGGFDSNDAASNISVNGVVAKRIKVR